MYSLDQNATNTLLDDLLEGKVISQGEICKEMKMTQSWIRLESLLTLLLKKDARTARHLLSISMKNILNFH